jgi:hypothetical protein
MKCVRIRGSDACKDATRRLSATPPPHDPTASNSLQLPPTSPVQGDNFGRRAEGTTPPKPLQNFRHTQTLPTTTSSTARCPPSKTSHSSSSSRSSALPPPRTISAQREPTLSTPSQALTNTSMPSSKNTHAACSSNTPQTCQPPGAVARSGYRQYANSASTKARDRHVFTRT